jgi:hypothetical protein
MSSTPSMLFGVFEGAAVVFVLIGLLSLRRHFARDFYVRSSPSVVREVTIWRAINHAIGRDFIAFGATLAAVAVWLWMSGTRPDVFALTCAGWVLLGATALMLHIILLVVERPR